MQAMSAGACVGWMVVSSALIMINKYLMSSDGFRFPMALSCLGMLFSSLASYLACRVGAYKPAWPIPRIVVAGHCTADIMPCLQAERVPGSLRGSVLSVLSPCLEHPDR